MLVPLGPGVDTGVHNPHGYTLNYNGKMDDCCCCYGLSVVNVAVPAFSRTTEFVVYDVSQVKMRYLVKLKFHFK